MNQRTALFAALLAWGLKGYDHTDVNNLVGENVLSENNGIPSIYFRGLSLRYMEKAITDLGDEPLSLPLLQTMILNTLCLLVQGVRGRAWRWLGTCIRSAYELNLHLIDSGRSGGRYQPINVEQWCIEEEWRRAWWAIWEMDVFASVIRRCPAGIDWSQNDTFLPAEDEKWYRGEPQSSCPLEVHAAERWKSLAATNIRSPKAWFIVLNSLMKDAQNISSPMNIDKPVVVDPATAQASEKKIPSNSQREYPRKSTDAVNRLNIVINSLYCAIMALPKELRYHGQSLDFGEVDKKFDGAVSQRYIHSHIYGIYMMTQLTKLMVLKYHVFRAGVDWNFGQPPNAHESLEADFNDIAMSSDASDIGTPESLHLTQYFEASENIVHITRRCSEDYYKHVNPFTASTMWLAGAVQLLQHSLLPEECSDRDLTKSNFDLLRLTYQRTTDFWNMSKVPLKHWDTLENGLANMRDNPSVEQRYHYDRPFIFTGGKTGHQTPSKRIPFSGTTQNNKGKFSSIDEIFKYLAADNTMAKKAALKALIPDQINAPGMQAQQDLPSISSLSNIYTPPPPTLDHVQYQNLCGITTSDKFLDTERQHPVGGAEMDVPFQSIFLDDGQFVLPHADMDFSNYLDEIFSGSYMP